MGYKRYSVIILFGCMLLLASCGTTELNYEKGFPKKESPALTNFVSHLISNHYYFLLQQDDNYIYGKEQEKDETKSKYYEYTDEQLKAYYKGFLKEEMTPDSFDSLMFSAREELFQSVENKREAHLPHIKMEKDNILRITTKEGKKRIDLPSLLKDQKVKGSDDIFFDVIAANDHEFQLNISDGKEEKTTLFIKQDLSDLVVIKDSSDLEQKLKSNELVDYQELFTSVGDEIDLIKMPNNYLIWDKEAKKIQNVGERDYFSEDGKYVYLEGNEREISDGEQQIQRIDDYFADNDNYETEFKISFKKIAKELDLNTSGVSIAKVIYLDKDYVALALNYKGRIVGDAGFTNVFIDLQDKENPTAHLVDLDWQF